MPTSTDTFAVTPAATVSSQAAGQNAVATPLPTAPVVSATVGADGVTVSGTGDPNTAVTITESGNPVGAATGDATGAWTFDAATLPVGAHQLVASETDTVGKTGSTPPLSVTVPDPRFQITDVVTTASTFSLGSDYPGPVNYLQAGYSSGGPDNSVVSALVGNVFIHAGSGETAEAAKSGNNVLDGGSGSSWLVGSPGSDAGNDTFFLSDPGTQQTWDTLLNFHVGDMLTMWGFDSKAGSTQSVGTYGAAGNQGETISVNFGHGEAGSTLVTFAGLSSAAQFTSQTGSTGGQDFLMLTRTA